MEKDFANAQAAISAYLAQQNEASQKSVLTSISAAFSPYSAHGFEE
jgi:hypothetical protein